jgi:hypothetical protein
MRMDGQADRQTDRHDETNSRFTQFCEHAQTFYMVPTLPHVIYKQQLLSHTTLTDFFMTMVESVYCTVRTESLYKTDYISSLEG